MWQVGKHVVHKNHGVAIIKRIEEKNVGGKKKPFYVLATICDAVTLIVPLDHDSLRELGSEVDIDAVYSLLKDDSTLPEEQTWNARYREYLEKLKTGSILNIAEVFRNLSLLRQRKDLSFGERKMMQQALQLLSLEIAMIRNCRVEEISNELLSLTNTKN